MEWKWVKTLLIFFFLILNVFLGYQVYQRNATSVVNSKTVESLNSILASRNIGCDFLLNNIETKKYMRKIKISNEDIIEEKFLPIASFSPEEVGYSGRNREIITLPSVLVSFLRETKIKDANIENIVLGYYPEISQIDKEILSGEATPAWQIKLESGEEYIYNAYTGNRIMKDTQK